HGFKPPNISQLLVSTTPSVAPALIAQRVKGRLQHIVRAAQPKAFRRHYSLRSLGSTRSEKLDASPEEVALTYMNNLAYAQGMSEVFRYSYFVGTFGEYDLGVIPRSA